MMKLTILFLTLIVVSSNLAQAQPVQENTGLETCKCIATYEYMPLCANNGVTYSNPSMLKCAQQCLKNDGITKMHDGRCAIKM